MTVRSPRVTVGVPVYNGERYLRETLDALRRQEYEDLEIVVSDNGSTDGTQAICEEMAGADPRIRYVRESVNRGTGWNFARLLDLASCELFMWNAADDVADPSYVARCVDALDTHPEAVLAFTRVRLIDEDSLVVGALGDADLFLDAPRPSVRLETFLERLAMHIEYGVARLDVIRSVGGEPPVFGGDVVLGARLLLRGPAVLVPEQLFSSRRHPGQGSRLVGVVAQVQENKPGATVRLAFPQWHLAGMLIGAALGAPLSAVERVANVRAVLRGWVARRWRAYPGDIRRNVVAIRARLSHV